MSTILSQVAGIHRERMAKKEKKRLAKTRAIEQAAAYFRDSGILEMWEDIKDIRIKNPAVEQVEGLTVSFAELIHLHDTRNLLKTGLTLYEEDVDVSWYVAWSLDDEKVQLDYRIDCINNNFSIPVDAPDARKKFIDKFVKWVARKITPQMLAEMDPELLEAKPENKKRGRKFLQVAE